jgi:leucyl-tRNA synthetase
MAYNFTAIEKKWQKYWLENKTFAALEPAEAAGMRKAYVLDMFPYPSGDGLHVGHCEQQTATDILCRYLRMTGVNVLHPMGWDAFGLPAEQHAIRSNEHPSVITQRSVDNFRRQIQMVGFGYDWDREINTTDPAYYKWTQWIFLQLFNSYFDPFDQKAKPIAHLENELENENFVVAPDGTIHINPTQEGMEPLAGEVRVERLWRELSNDEKRDVIDGQRLAYTDEVPVNWCPALGTVLANEEVIDGKSDIGGHPVEKRPMRQWLLRITAYADRLLSDLDLLDWPDSLKEMQRNWIGKSIGAEVDFEIADWKEAGRGDDDAITVFTTRPDTLFGATYMVLAPEHPLVDRITTAEHRAAVEKYRSASQNKSDRERMVEAKEKSGVFTGSYAINPLTKKEIPVWIADYVLMGYGTGAIMAVPAQDQRDWDFAEVYNLPIVRTVQPPDGFEGKAYLGDGPAMNSDFLNGLNVADAKAKMIDHLEASGIGHRTVHYKLRDWLFSRQRYWGEPFPILMDAEGRAGPLQEHELPLVLPPMTDFRPTGTPEPPLSKASDWVNVTRDGSQRKRETNVMPQWAGSCWYYLRYIDPKNSERFVDPEKEKYWMPVDLYVGGVEHAVLHLLYARFWHKVLFDLGHVSTAEPFQRLVNQGIITGEAEYWTDTTPPRKVDELEVEKLAGGLRLKSEPSVAVHTETHKMSKSRGNVVNPDDICRDYGADTFRLYEMYMGPLDAPKPWNTRDIVGMSRFLNSVWRNLVGDEETQKFATIQDSPLPEAIDRQMHYTIRKVADDITSLRFNTAIAELIKLNNEMGKLQVIPRDLAETFVLMLAPFAPHIAEEIWSRLGHTKSLARRPWPTYDPAKLLESTLELPVQVNGKLRDRITVAADADEATILQTAESAERVKPWVSGKTIQKKLYVPRKLVNLVVK